MSVTNFYDCTDDAEKYTWESYGFACWYTKPLPNVLKGLVGPVTRPCDCQCYNFPDTPMMVSFERTSDCQWSADLWTWVCSAFQQPIILFVTPWEKILQEFPNINPITNVFQLGSARNVTGSCSYNYTSGQTTGQISGIVQFEPDCTCPGESCEVAVTIYFDES